MIMFSPRYTISPALLQSMQAIAVTGAMLNRKALPADLLTHLSADVRARRVSASVAIEGNPLSLTAVKELLRQGPALAGNSLAQQEVLNYDAALSYVSRHNEDRFNLKLILEVQRLVTDGVIGNPYHVGALRRDAVFIMDPRTHQPVFLPPRHEDVPALLDELLLFVEKNRGVLDPVLLAGLFHKQFVIIHPFMDGNGRTVRLLTGLLLSLLGVDLWSLVSFEDYYNRNVTAYFASVGEQGDYYDLADQVDFTDWLTYFAGGLAEELRLVAEVIDTHMRSSFRLQEHHCILLAYAREHGSITMQDYATLTSRALSTRSKDLHDLVQAGYLERIGQGKASWYRPLPI